MLHRPPSSSTLRSATDLTTPLTAVYRWALRSSDGRAPVPAAAKGNHHPSSKRLLAAGLNCPREPWCAVVLGTRANDEVLHATPAPAPASPTRGALGHETCPGAR